MQTSKKKSWCFPRLTRLSESYHCFAHDAQGVKSNSLPLLDWCQPNSVTCRLSSLDMSTHTVYQVDGDCAWEIGNLCLLVYAQAVAPPSGHALHTGPGDGETG